jgi:hypothetical protein
MIQILNLTNSDAVRAALGISEDSKELEDYVLQELRLDRLLKIELSTWLPTYKEIAEDPLAEVEDTTEELRLFLLQGYATYWCAYTMMMTGEVSFALRHEDGQNKMIRQTYDVEELLNRLLTRALQYKSQLLSLISPSPAALVNWFIGSAQPNYDPITNAGVN